MGSPSANPPYFGGYIVVYTCVAGALNSLSQLSANYTCNNTGVFQPTFSPCAGRESHFGHSSSSKLRSCGLLKDPVQISFQPLLAVSVLRHHTQMELTRLHAQLDISQPTKCRQTFTPAKILVGIKRLVPVKVATIISVIFVG